MSTTKEAICFELLCDEVSKRLTTADRAISDDDAARVIFGERHFLTRADLNTHFGWGRDTVNNLMRDGIIFNIGSQGAHKFRPAVVIAAIRRGLSILNQPA